MAIAKNDRRKKTTRGKSKSIYSKSEKNSIIDSVVHPLADEHWGFIVIDCLLHAKSASSALPCGVESDLRLVFFEDDFEKPEESFSSKQVGHVVSHSHSDLRFCNPTPYPNLGLLNRHSHRRTGHASDEL